jgi:hypothetical protein
MWGGKIVDVMPGKMEEALSYLAITGIELV